MDKSLRCSSSRMRCGVGEGVSMAKRIAKPEQVVS
jgi:hypothetical protein